MNTPGTYLAGAFAFTCNWIISQGCWAIPYGMGNTPCFGVLFPVGRSGDSSWCLSPPFEVTDVWTVHITEVSCLGPCAHLLAPRWGLCSEPGTPVASWMHLENYILCPALSLPHLSWTSSLWVEKRNSFGVEDVIFKRRVSDTRWQRWLKGWQSFISTGSLGRGSADVLSIWYSTLNWPKSPSNPVLEGNLK